MHSTETLRSIATNLRKLSKDAEDELAAQLVCLANEYERMAGQPRPENRPSLSLWRTDAG
jgi:hypothetical protein